MKTTLLIDARNVLRSEWPNIPEDELVVLCSAWAEARGHRAIVVFDREAPGGFVGVREFSSSCSVVGTGAELADEWIVRAAEEFAAARRRYWLVTSDRALRAAAAATAERTIGGGSFARELRGG